MLNGMLIVFKTLPKAIESKLQSDTRMYLTFSMSQLIFVSIDRQDMEKFYGDGIDDEDEFGEPITGSSFEEDEIEDAGGIL
jgi:hypothetical protein